MKIKHLQNTIMLFSFMPLLYNNKAMAQEKISDSSNSATNPGAILELESNNKGFILPRISLTNTSTWNPLLGNSTNGTLVYNKNESITSSDSTYPIIPSGTGLYVWNNNGWVAISLNQSNNIDTSVWTWNGNYGTTDKFVGTTNDVPLLLKANNTLAGSTGSSTNFNVAFGWAARNPFNNGDGNTSMGTQALQYNSGYNNVGIGTWANSGSNSGSNNTVIGHSAMAQASGSYVTSIGQATLFHNTVDGSTAVGYAALNANTTGMYNAAFGFNALRNNTTGLQNTASGFNALINNTTGLNNSSFGSWSMVNNTTGSHNTAVGLKALYTNNTGEYNTALGAQTMQLNTTGYWNTALGSGALYSNTSGYLNTAAGTSAMWFNTEGYWNTSLGEEALAGNTTGDNNTAMGFHANWALNTNGDNTLDNTSGSKNTVVGSNTFIMNTTGSYNTTLGYRALVFNSTGNNNVCVGANSGFTNVTGSNNTILGVQANFQHDSITNATAIGYNANVSSSNTIQIGNSDVTDVYFGDPSSTIIHGQLSTPSDARFKYNIQKNIPGLAFILKLKPVTYNFDGEKLNTFIKTGIIDSSNIKNIAITETTNIRRSGFLAQDVALAAKEAGYDFDGVITPEQNPSHYYSLNYSQFVVSLVKSVQELYDENVQLKNKLKELDQLKADLQEIKNSLQKK